MILASAAALLTSCTHKELCYNHREHAHRYHVEIFADYRQDWEENYGHIDWKANWPEHYIPYDELRPEKPDGLRVINYDDNGNSDIHNISSEGGVVSLYEGYNDILIYNNDTEYIVFSRSDQGATTKAATKATTRTRTRSTYKGSEFATKSEETITPPDMLYANYLEGVISERTLDPVGLDIVLQPLVYTYKVRYEFASGLEYVAMARGALSGMASSVLMNTGETSDISATLMYDCQLKDYGIGALVNSFGVPSMANQNYPTRGQAMHALNLEVVLKNGKMLTFDFDVTDQVQKQPHGGVIVVSGITVSKEDGLEGTGGFDVSVNDWGEYEDVILPLM